LKKVQSTALIVFDAAAQAARSSTAPPDIGWVGEKLDRPTVQPHPFARRADVQYHVALFQLLAKQYEAGKIDEARDTLFVQQLDIALRPGKHSWPKRFIFVLVVTITALLLAIMAAFYLENIERANEDPQFAAGLQLFQFYLRGGQKS
jgi:hypothetical protein